MPEEGLRPSVVISIKLRLSCISKKLKRSEKEKQIKEIFSDTLEVTLTTTDIEKVDAIYSEYKTYLPEYNDLMDQKKLQIFLDNINQTETKDQLRKILHGIIKKHEKSKKYFHNIAIFDKLIEEATDRFELLINADIKSANNTREIDRIIDEFVDKYSNIMVASNQRKEQIRISMAKKKTTLLLTAVESATTTRRLTEINRSLRKRAGYILSQSTVGFVEKQMSEKAFRLFFSAISLSNPTKLEKIADEICVFAKINSYFCVDAKESLIEIISEEAAQYFYLEISRVSSDKLDNLLRAIESSSLITCDIKSDLKNIIVRKKVRTKVA